MPRAVPLLSAFNRGELSPLMQSRVDLDIYQKGWSRMENLIPLAQGPATRRPGTLFTAISKGNAGEVLIPFEFSTVQAYIIEAGDTYFRFFMNDGQIEVSPGTPYEIVTTYSAAALAALQWAQSADVLYLASETVAPAKLTRTGHTSWTLSAISFTGTVPPEWVAGNYPRTVSFFQGRLWWGGTPNEPQTVWGSKSGDFEDLTPGPAAEDGLKYTIDDDQMNAIRWMRAGRVLLIGTASGEFALSGGGSNDPVTPSNIQVLRQGTVGSAQVASAQVGNSVLFVQRAKRKMIEVAYSFQDDGYITGELSLMGSHLLRGKVKRMAWQQEPWRVLWCCLESGKLIGLTYMKDQNVVGWHPHPIGGVGVKVLSVAATNGEESGQLWLLVERTINGGTKRYVERLGGEFWPDEDEEGTALADAIFMDSAITYSGSPATTITGLGHLEGQTVQVLTDGATHPERVVTSGQITLQIPASKVQVGLRADAMARSNDLSVGALDGTAQTRVRRVSEVGLVLYQSMGFRIGYWDPQRKIEVLDLLETRRQSDPLDAPPPMVSGTLPRAVKVASDWQREIKTVIRSDQPLPLTLVAFAPRVHTNG